jgi:hypothetical protein
MTSLQLDSGSLDDDQLMIEAADTAARAAQQSLSLALTVQQPSLEGEAMRSPEVMAMPMDIDQQQQQAHTQQQQAHPYPPSIAPQHDFGGTIGFASQPPLLSEQQEERQQQDGERQQHAAYNGKRHRGHADAEERKSPSLSHLSDGDDGRGGSQPHSQHSHHRRHGRRHRRYHRRNSSGSDTGGGTTSDTGGSSTNVSSSSGVSSSSDDDREERQAQQGRQLQLQDGREQMDGTQQLVSHSSSIGATSDSGMPLFAAVTTEIETVVHLLASLVLDKDQRVKLYVGALGIKVVSEHEKSRTTCAKAYLKKELFSAYEVNPLRMSHPRQGGAFEYACVIQLPILLNCLQIFGVGTTHIGPPPTLHMQISGEGHDIELT